MARRCKLSLAMLMLVACAAVGSDLDRAAEYNAQGVEYYGEGRWSEAVELFEQAYGLSPDNATVCRNLCNAYQACANELTKTSKFSEAGELLEASEEARNDSYDLWSFTRQINEAATPAERRSIVEEIWRVIYADGTLDAHEDFIVHKLAKLLKLNHPQLIEAKLKAKQSQTER